MRNVRPFYGRVTVLESPVDEAERDSGIIVPLKHEGGDLFKRGVVLHVSTEPAGLGADLLQEGQVVYYRRGTRIFDVIVVDLCDVIAYEE